MEASTVKQDIYYAALEYAKHGIAVFPLKPGSKRPAIDDWENKATTDPKTIKLWFGNGKPHNIGVACGPSGLTIIDIDEKDGKEGINDFYKATGESAAHAAQQTLTVITPSGGMHLYYKGEGYGNANTFPDSIDVRGKGGYVVGFGSEFDGSSYDKLHLKEDVFIDDLPDIIIPYLKSKREKSDRKDLGIELDRDEEIDRAIDYLMNQQPAVQGAGGDYQTFKVAAGVFDFAISKEMALELLLDYYNPRCMPPWQPDDLQVKVENAFQYRDDPVGRDSDDGVYEMAMEGLKRPRKKDGSAKSGDKTGSSSVSIIDWEKELPEIKDIPPRPWLLGTSLLRGKLSVLVADGGVGKSTYSLQMAAALVTDRDDICHQKPHDQTSVLVINNEDDDDEMARRIAAMQKEFHISSDELAGRLHVHSGVRKPLVFAVRGEKGKIVPAPWIKKFKRELIDHNIGLLVIDPFVETHEADENSNKEIGTVAMILRSIAADCNCAVLVIHHTTKPPQQSSDGYAGDMHRARGASALVSAARIVQTVYKMSDKEFDEYQADGHRYEYVRIDDAKANLSKMKHEPSWFRFKTVHLDNGDDCATLQPVKLSTVEETTDVDIKKMIAEFMIDVNYNECSLQIIATMLETQIFNGVDVKKIKEIVKKQLAKPFLLHGNTFTLITVNKNGKPKPAYVRRENAKV